MKHVFLALLIIFSSALAAQTILDEDNVWTYCTRGYDNPSGEGQLVELTFTKYYISGDTVIAGKLYKQIWTQNATVLCKAGQALDGEPSFSAEEYLMGVREKNGVVYVNEDEYRTLAEIIDPNDPIAWHMNRLDGNEYILYDFNEQQPNGIIPYIGNINTLFVQRSVPLDGIYRDQSLNLFFRNGKLAYKSPDFQSDPFYPELTDAIVPIMGRTTHPDHDTIYNLHGQQQVGLAKGINIVNGRKILVK